MATRRAWPTRPRRKITGRTEGGIGFIGIHRCVAGGFLNGKHHRLSMLLTAADCPSLTSGRKREPAPEGAGLYFFVGSGVGGVDFMLDACHQQATWRLPGSSELRV